MDYKKTNAPTNTVTRNMADFVEETGNVYESVAIIGKRSNQIAAEMKDELLKKLNEFSSSTDNLEEQFENHEQIEISRYYERLPKPTLIAAQEFLDGKVYFRDPSKDNEEEDQRRRLLLWLSAGAVLAIDYLRCLKARYCIRSAIL